MASIEGEVVKSKTIEGDVKMSIAATPDIQVGVTETLEPGSEAYVELAEGSTRLSPVFNFGIPKGIDGEDYMITENDYATIEGHIREQINPTLESNLENAKVYADSIKPTKTSQLTNDSNFATTNSNNNFTAPQTINGTLTINGNIVQNGEQYETHAEKVYTKNDEIITREGAVGGLSEGEFSGIKAEKYDGKNDGRLGFNADGEARVGDVGDEQPLLTRDEIVNLTDDQLLKWDGIQLKAVGVDVAQVIGSVKASETQFGTIKVWTSTNEDGEIGLNISTEV